LDYSNLDETILILMNDWITTYCNLSPSSFVIILTTQLRSEIGLKSLIVVGVFTLGTKVIKELLRARKSTTPVKKSIHSM
jgi:hypothetical protein